MALSVDRLNASPEAMPETDETRRRRPPTLPRATDDLVSPRTTRPTPAKAMKSNGDHLDSSLGCPATFRLTPGPLPPADETHLGSIRIGGSQAIQENKELSRHERNECQSP